MKSSKSLSRFILGFTGAASLLGVLFALALNSSVFARQDSLSFGVVQTSLSTSSAGAVTGTAYALPAGAANVITWQITSDGTPTVTLQGSLDNSTYFTIDSVAATGIRSTAINALKFVRASQTSRAGGTTTAILVTAQRTFLTNSQTTASFQAGMTASGNLLFSPTNTYTIGTSRTANAPSIIYSGTGIETGSYFGVAGLGLFTAPADGVFLFRNNAGNSFTSLRLGGSTTSFPSITRSSQGVIIQEADDTPTVFASLGASTDGTMVYCSDCTFANPCAGAGTGAYAKRLNGAWRCD